MVPRYSGQQKLATFKRLPDPKPPPDRPNPCPLELVSATALPLRSSAPLVGVLLRASLFVLSIFASDFFGALAFGSIISGARAAGGRTASMAFRASSCSV